MAQARQVDLAATAEPCGHPRLDVLELRVVGSAVAAQER